MSLDPTYKPLLRYVDLIPGEYQGQAVFFLRDPVGIVEEIVTIPQELIFLLALMDGNHDLRDLQAEATRKSGEIVPFEEIEKFVSFLDEKGFLWSKNFEEIKEQAYKVWFQQRIRPMAHANSAYPLEEKEAREFLNQILSLAKADGAKPPRILIAPHIDLRVGAKCYAEAYSRFNIPSGSRIIILGVGHHLDYPYSLLTKDMATPFGLLRNDRGGLLYLSQTKKLELFPDHMAHKLEHSLEFQGLFLHYLKGNEIVVLPLLIGSFFILKQNKEFVEKLIEGLLELFDERTYMVLGIDFCHLGLRYGDSVPLDVNLAERALHVDREILELTFLGKTNDLEKVLEENEKLKICGGGPLYLLSLFIEKGSFNGRGEIFYQEMLPFGKGSGVSVAGAGYYI
ncbi:MAG: AmmeMemoRadiSam system protein B [Caldimicrobium sp.]